MNKIVRTERKPCIRKELLKFDLVVHNKISLHQEQFVETIDHTPL